jgi:hypothetical protein
MCRGKKWGGACTVYAILLRARDVMGVPVAYRAVAYDARRTEISCVDDGGDQVRARDGRRVSRVAVSIQHKGKRPGGNAFSTSTCTPFRVRWRARGEARAAARRVWSINPERRCLGGCAPRVRVVRVSRGHSGHDPVAILRARAGMARAVWLGILYMWLMEERPLGLEGASDGWPRARLPRGHRKEGLDCAFRFPFLGEYPG